RLARPGDRVRAALRARRPARRVAVRRRRGQRGRRHRWPVRRAQARLAGEEHHLVPARPGQRQVAGGQPAARPRPSPDRRARPHHRDHPARRLGPGHRGVPGRPAAPRRPRRDHPPGPRPVRHVRAGPLDPLRLLHLPGRAGPVAPGLPIRPRPGRAPRPRSPSLRQPTPKLARAPAGPCCASRAAVPCPARRPDDRRAYCGLVRHGPRATGVTEADDAVAATPAAEKDPGRAGWLFGAVTVIPALLAAAWLLPAFPLLLGGRLAARPMVFMFAPLAAGLCYFAVRQLPAAWPAFREASQPREASHPREASQPREAGQPRESTRKPASKPATQWWALAATVAVAIAFTVWQLAERTEQIIYLRDPATYLQVAYWIAHHGLLPIPDNAAAFGGPHLGLDFASSNYYPRGTGIVPQFMTGAPLVLAAGFWLHGINGALLVTPVI